MSSPGFEFFKRIGDERIERNTAGDALKKYCGMPTSPPTHSKVQYLGQSHTAQQADLNQAGQNITEFFRNY